MLGNERDLIRHNHFEEVRVAGSKYLLDSLLHESIELVALIFLHTGFSHCNQTLNGFVVQISFQRVPHESFNQGLHLGYSLTHTVTLSV